MKEIRKDIEISIYDMLIYICQRWRTLVICFVVGALILGAYGWLKSGTATINSDADESVYTAGLSESQIATINIKAQRIANLEKMYEMQQDFAEKSVLMKLNPYMVYVGKAQFQLEEVGEAEPVSEAAEPVEAAETTETAATTETSAEITETETAEIATTDEFAALIKSDEFAIFLESKLEPTLGKTGDQFYYYEDICHVDTWSYDGILEVEFFGTSDEVVNIMANAVVEFMSGKGFAAKQNALSIYTSADVSFDVCVGLDGDTSDGTVIMTLHQYQQQKLDEMEEVASELETEMEAVDSSEQAYCDYLLTQYRSGHRNAQSDEAASEETIASSTTFTRHISVKYIGIGGILGVVLAVIVLIIKYIVEALLRNGNDVIETYGFSLLAVFEGHSKFYSHHKLGIDNWLRRKRIRSQIIPYEDNVDLLATQVYITVSQRDYAKVCVAIGPGVQDECAFLDALKAKIKGTAEISVVNNIQAASEALFDMTTVDGVVLVEQADCSKFRDMDAEVRLCQQYGADVIGVVVVQ